MPCEACLHTNPPTDKHTCSPQTCRPGLTNDSDCPRDKMVLKTIYFSLLPLQKPFEATPLPPTHVNVVRLSYIFSLQSGSLFTGHYTDNIHVLHIKINTLQNFLCIRNTVFLIRCTEDFISYLFHSNRR